MGVKGLWKLLLPIGRRISIETLAGKTLAIDASIWLTQFLKAMRDPETGKLVRSAHLIGFFRRICRLKFHRIRPVFVFDGATPEIKRAEVLRRKRKRDTFADSLDKSAMQRLAKKLLTERLRKSKAINSGKTANSGGFEVGFNPGQSQWSKSEETLVDDTEQATKDARNPTHSMETDSKVPGNFVDLMDSDGDNDKEPKPVSDWDLPISSDLDTQNQGQEVTTERQAAVFSADDGSLAVDLVSSMSTDAERKDAIELARKNQRMRSRQEFMPAAANPQDFSSVQMRNFLKYCKLNRDIATMAKKVADRRTQRVGPTTKTQTSSVEFIQHEETESENDSDENESVTSETFDLMPLLKRKLGQKGKPLGLHHRSSNTEEENSSDDGGKSVVELRPRKNQTRKRAILDSSSDDESIAGSQSSGLTTQAKSSISNKRSSETSDPRGGFILSKHETQPATTPMQDAAADAVSDDFALAKVLQESEDSAYAHALNEELEHVDNEVDNEDESSPSERTNHSRKVEAKTCGIEYSKSDSEESMEDVDWEDGATSENVEHSVCNEAKQSGTPEGLNSQQTFDGDFQISEQSESESGHTNWSKFDGASRRQGTAEALRQAETTASNLANWAGRAFRRALKEVHHPAESPSPVIEDRNTVDLLFDKDEQVVSDEHCDAGSIQTVAATDQGSTFGGRSPGSTPAESTGDPHSKRRPDNKTTPTIPRRNRMDGFDWSAIRRQQERETDTISDEMLEESKLLLQLFGIPYVEAPAEAEAQCVALEKLGIVDGIVTEDSDAFVFGAQKVYKQIFDEQKYAEAYVTADAEKEMNLNNKSMVALALLLGGDYTAGVKGVGIVNAMEILEAFDVSENVEQGLVDFKSWLNGFDPFVGGTKSRQAPGSVVDRRKERFHDQHKSARSRWVLPGNFPSKEVLNAYFNPVVDQSAEDFTWGAIDEVNLVKFCEAYLRWEPEETLKQLKPILEAQTAGLQQRRIDSYMRYEDSIKFGEINSKRLQKVLKRKTQEKRGASSI